MRRPYSLRRRLLIGLLAAMAGIGGLALLDTWRQAVGTANAVSDRVLAGSVLAIAERVVVTEDDALEVDVPYVALEMLTSSAQDRVFYRVDGPDGFITGYQNLPRGEPGTQIAFTDAEFRGDAIRLGALQRSASSGTRAIPFSVTVAETTIARSQLARSLLLQSALRLGVLAAVAGLAVWLAVSLSLRPLDRLGGSIGRRSPLDLRPIEDRVPREVQGLVEAVNSFIRRLGSAIEALRHFTGNASHQLRTPMTIVRTQLALAARAETPGAKAAAIATADAAVAEAERLLSQMLLLARIDEAAVHRSVLGAVDLSALAEQQTAEHVVAAHAAGIDLGFESEGPALVSGDATLLGELVRNLIENAIAYAGRDSEATLRVSRTAGTRLEMIDNGKGVDPGDLPLIRRRFGRASPDRSGAGLGLPIVEEIATLFGGTIEIASAPGRGFEVRIDFPPAPRAA